VTRWMFFFDRTPFCRLRLILGKLIAGLEAGARRSKETPDDVASRSGLGSLLRPFCPLFESVVLSKAVSEFFWVKYNASRAGFVRPYAGPSAGSSGPQSCLAA